MSKSYESGYDPKLGYNKHAFENPPPQLVVIGKTVKLIAAPIGLVSEAIHNYRDKKRAKSGQSDPSSHAAESSSEKNDELDPPPAYVNLPAEEADKLIAAGEAVPADDKEPTHELIPAAETEEFADRDEADWALDDAAADLEEKTDLESVEKIAYGKAPASNPSQATPAKLPFPVILPQRRPATKTRGFVRAYAPVLQDAGIDRDTFLKFLRDLHQHAQASPIFNVIKLGTNIAGAFPEPIVFGSALAVQVVNEMGQEVHERWRTNKFLEEVNRDLFMPHGLYAVVVTWMKGGDPEKVETETVDIGGTALAKYSASQNLATGEVSKDDISKMEELRIKSERLRITSASTTESQMPILSAELVFPALDATQDASEGKAGEKQRGWIKEMVAKEKRTAKFVDSYFDRRAQATYMAANPNATLTKHAAPLAPTFKSKYADPTNHTNLHFFTLITGGLYKAEPLGAKRRWEKAQRKAAEERAQGLKDKPKKRILGENVLYLAIVNLPSEEEIEKAKQKIKADKEEKQKKKQEKNE